MKWIRRGSALAVLLIGWVFILFANNFHITTPVVFVGLGYLAAVAAVYTLFRTGATAVATNEDLDDDAFWGVPLTALGELEREKRTLLKAIKEAEFDREMGKLSQADADGMIALYRARAIEVIKEIDIANSTSGKAGSVRDKILREARARLELETKAAPAKAASPSSSSDAAGVVGAGSKKRDRAAERQKKRADRAANRATADAATDAARGDAARGDADRGDAASDDAARGDAADASASSTSDTSASSTSDVSASSTTGGADAAATTRAAADMPSTGSSGAADLPSDATTDATATASTTTSTTSKEAAR